VLPDADARRAVAHRRRGPAIDFFFLRASRTVLIVQDVETTVSDPGTTRSDTMRVAR
jgi:hypothetical protein